MRTKYEHHVRPLARHVRQVVSAAGAVDHDAVVQLAEKAFGGLSSDPTTATDLIKAVRIHNVLHLGAPHDCGAECVAHSMRWVRSPAESSDETAGFVAWGLRTWCRQQGRSSSLGLT